MIKNLNNTFFNKKGITNKGIIFFLQRWFEIFDQRTLSTYQYSVLNIIYGMNEFLQTINKTLDGSFTTYDNIETCREELLRAFKEDDIISKHMPSLCGQIKQNLGNKINNKKDENSARAVLLRTKAEVNYTLKLIEPHYQTWLMDELLDDIKNEDIKQIKKHIKSLASYCIYIGWTAYGASNLISKIFISDDGLSLDESWELLKTKLSENQMFKIYINFKGGKQNLNEVVNLIREFGIPVLKYDEIINIHNDILPKDLPLNKEKEYMSFEIEAKDIKSAALKAVNILNGKITILAFYDKILPVSLSDLDIFAININDNKDKRPFKVKDLYKTYLFQDSSNKVFENAIRLYSNNDEKLRTTKIALNGVFNYANISLVSVFPEEKFMNLWIAIESFMRTGQYSNIISHVKEILPAVISKRYIYRIMRNFAEDCIRCRIRIISFNDGIQINLLDESKQKVVEDLISAIQDEVKYNEMKTICSINFLLADRLDELKELLKDNFSVISKIRRYYETSLWHIQRLYRIRNEIAHSALNEDNYLITYIEHLYDYLAILIAEIVFICTEKQITEIDEIFPLLKDNYEAYNSTADLRKSLVSEFQLKNGIIDYI